MPRFVILEHDHPVLHWDLMLEARAVLATWRLPAALAPDTPFEAERTFDHRPLYLDYEGPISGGRGQVVRWEAGTFEWLVCEEERIVVQMEGGRLGGELQLDRQAWGLWRGLLKSVGQGGGVGETGS